MFKETEKYWKGKKEQTTKNGNDRKILIEIGAQHPLKDGDKPGEEFEARLKRAIEIYEDEIAKGNDVIFYIPGSKHCIIKDGKQIDDKIALAEAGRNYLIEHGINPGIIRGDDANKKYKGEKGVYNSGDECFVASKLFEDEDCGRLISVVSPVQVFRKGIFYSEFGIKPEIHSVPLENTYHNYIGEFFWSLYVTTFLDHDWQGDDSFLSVLTRVERCMGYKCNDKEQETLRDKKIIIPKEIMKIKEFLMQKYNVAKENMQSDNSKESTLIQVDVSDNYEKEMVEVVKICMEQQKKENRVCISVKNEQDGIRINSLLQDKGINEVEFKVLENSSKEFLSNQYGSLYCVCPSDKVMETAISSIHHGVLPLIVAVPSENDDYIEETFSLYDNIIGKDLINKSNNPNTEKVPMKEIVRGLLGATDTGIDVENLDDIESYFLWSNNYLEGEYSEERY